MATSLGDLLKPVKLPEFQFISLHNGDKGYGSPA